MTHDRDIIDCRSVFISDVHLGTRGAQAEELLDVLDRVRCENLFLVGDILDLWRLKRRWHWPEAHNRVVRKLLDFAAQGTRVVYVPGNHDEWARQYAGMDFAGVRVEQDADHTTADGTRLLVTHGDQFDMVVTHARLVSMLGAWAYETLLAINRIHNRVRRMLGIREWSLSRYIKLKVKSACVYISKFEDALIDEARERGFDAVMCGHIHHPEIRDGDIRYYNCGDWIESASAIIEHHDGRLELRYFGSLQPDADKTEPTAPAAAEPATADHASL